MSSLHSILNPEDRSSRRSSRLTTHAENNHRSKEDTLSPVSDLSGNTTGDLIQDSRNVVAAAQDHEAHPDCPDTLTCLPDTDGRPQHTLPVILRCAILGSSRKRLTIREIYAAMEEKYSYYKTAGPTWKQSVRHHLSLNRLFERQPRPVTDPGFGSYWTVNLAAPPGTKRPRKRGRPNKGLSHDVVPLVKRRGRPRKNVGVSPPPESLRDDGDDMLTSEERGEDDHIISEPDYESEEEMSYPFEHHEAMRASRNLHGLNGSTTNSSQQNTRLPHTFGESSNHVIDRLQIEMASLRRQSAEAVSVSLRVSDQLAEAQAEVSRVRAALRTAENMLEDEARKRREAERALDDESKLRRIAEEALRAIEARWSTSDNPS